MPIKCPVHDVFAREIHSRPDREDVISWCPQGGCLIRSSVLSDTATCEHPKDMVFPEVKEDWGDIDPDLL